MSKRITTYLPLIAVLGLAALLRVWGLAWGLPSATHYFSYHPDESRVLQVAMFNMSLLTGHPAAALLQLRLAAIDSGERRQLTGVRVRRRGHCPERFRHLVSAVGEDVSDRARSDSRDGCRDGLGHLCARQSPLGPKGRVAGGIDSRDLAIARAAFALADGGCAGDVLGHTVATLDGEAGDGGMPGRCGRHCLQDCLQALPRRPSTTWP